MVTSRQPGSSSADPQLWAGVLQLADPPLWAGAGGSQPLILVRTYPKFQVWATSRGFSCGHPDHLWRCAHTQVLSVCAPRQPGRLSGCAPTRGVRCGPQATDWGMHPLGHFGSGTQAARPLIRVCAHPGFQLWAPSLLIWVRTSWASGESWCCLSGLHSPGAERGGAPEAAAAGESSLTSCCVPLFSFPF